MALDLTAELDVTTDFETVCDWLESITLTLPDGTESTVTQALRRAVTQREGGSETPEDTEGQTMMLDTRWHLPLAEVATAPLVGSLISTASNIWEVVWIDWQAGANRWLCSCRKIYTLDGSGTKFTLQFATYSKADEGDATLVWTAGQYIEAVGSMSLVSERPEIRQDSQVMIKSYVAFLTTDTTFEGPMRIIDSDGVTYNVVAGAGRKQIGKMQRLECEREEMGR